MREFMKIVEDAAYYTSLTPEALRDFARMEDDNSDGTIKVEDCDWVYDPAFPLSKLHGLMTDGDWAGWMKDEIAMDRDEELNRDWSELTKEEVHTPIIVATDGSVAQLWNGWHRTAGSIVRGAETIPAIVGRKRSDVTESAQRYTREQLEAVDIDELDRMAFGYVGDQEIEIDPNDVTIKWHDDLANPEFKYRTMGGMDWVKSVDFSEPVELSISEPGKIELEDGHHRWFAAKRLGRKLRGIIQIKGNPINVILARQG